MRLCCNFIANMVVRISGSFEEPQTRGSEVDGPFGRLDQGRFSIQQVKSQRLSSFLLFRRVTSLAGSCFSTGSALGRNEKLPRRRVLKLSTAAQWQAAPGSRGGNACEAALRSTPMGSPIRLPMLIRARRR